MRNAFKIGTFLFLLITPLMAQIEFYPKVDTLFTGGGCTPTQIYASLKRGENTDTLVVLPDWNTHFWSGNYADHQKVYFLIPDSLNYRPELWIIHENFPWAQNMQVPLDSSFWFEANHYNLTLYMKDQETVIDSLAQFCIAKIGIGVDAKKSNQLSSQPYFNYPNPFNPNTSISYVLPTAEHVTLTIFDLRGHQVAQFNESQVAGYHEMIWEASAFASGIYIARIHAGDFSKSIKMMLVK